jgi:hypothetical protein
MSSPTDKQKKQVFEGLSAEPRGKQSYCEWAKEAYHDAYDKWVPWLEDKYLALFGKDNKASYVTKGECVCAKCVCLALQTKANLFLFSSLLLHQTH